MESTVERRVSPAFTADGERAACVLVDGAGRASVEVTGLDGRSPVPRALAGPVGVRCQVVPSPDGRAVSVSSAEGVHRLSLHGLEDVVGLGESRAPALRLVPGRDRRVLAWLVAGDGERSALSRVDARTLAVAPVAVVEGRVAGAVWWSGDVAVMEVFAGRVRRIVRVDTRTGATRTVPTSGPVTLLAAVGDELLVRPPQGTVTGWLGADGSRLRALSCQGVPRALAVDPAGKRVALRVDEGVRSRLMIGEAGAAEVSEPPLPPGVVRAAGWGRRGLHLFRTDPLTPPGLVTVDPDAGMRSRGAPGARAEVFAGPAGPIEAVVYGDRVRARHLVVALHGGPEAAWDLGWDPLFARLSAAGVAVVAPNQRGSTGYGPGHRRAIRGVWGGPDLADVLWLREALAAARPRAQAPALFGTSYGAFLALLAAAAEPDLWSRCAAVAPFLSARRLHADAGPAVRSLIERLDGREDVADALGPRDLVRLASRVTAPVLIAHGTDDDVIPVAHARTLAGLLGAAYREVPGGGHDLLTEPGGEGLTGEIAAFLSGAGDGR